MPELITFPALSVAGNYGKAVGARKSKKSQSREDLRRSREDLTEEAQGLLESDDDLDREEMQNPEPDIRSVSAAVKPQPTEFDRWEAARLFHFAKCSSRVYKVWHEHER